MTSKSSSRGINGRRRGHEQRYEEIIQEDCEAQEEVEDNADHMLSNRQRYMHTNLGNLYSQTSTSNNSNSSSSSTSLSFNKIILALLIFTSIFGLIYYGLSKKEVRKIHEMEVHEFEEVERLKLKYGLVEKVDSDDGEKSESVEGGDVSTSATDVSAIVKDEGNKIDNNKAPQSEKKSSEKGEYELSSDMDELRSIIQELRIEIKSLQSQSAEIGELRNKTSVLLEELEGEKLKVSALEEAVRSVASSLRQSLPIKGTGGGGGVRRRRN